MVHKAMCDLPQSISDLVSPYFTVSSHTGLLYVLLLTLLSSIMQPLHRLFLLPAIFFLALQISVQTIPPSSLTITAGGSFSVAPAFPVS